MGYGIFIQMKTILVAVDFSATTRPVVSEAAALARSLKARIVLLHVVQLPVFVNDYSLMVETGNLTEVMEKYASRQLQRWQERLSRKVRVKTVQLSGYPVSLILAEARKLAADYIVIGSHGHTAVYDLLVGSTTSGVLRGASCPVVIVASRRPQRRRA